MRVLIAWIFGFCLQVALGVTGTLLGFKAVMPASVDIETSGRHVCGLGVLASLVFATPFALLGLVIGIVIATMIKDLLVWLAKGEHTAKSTNIEIRPSKEARSSKV